jgi:hypothetical protein
LVFTLQQQQENKSHGYGSASFPCSGAEQQQEKGMALLVEQQQEKGMPLLLLQRQQPLVSRFSFAALGFPLLRSREN